MNASQEATILALLQGADRGDYVLHIKQHPEDNGMDGVYQICDTFNYLDRVWTVRVFFDVGDWDYVESITSPNGHTWEYPDGVTKRPMTQALGDWMPEHPERWGWKIEKPPSKGLLAIFLAGARSARTVRRIPRTSGGPSPTTAGGRVRTLAMVRRMGRG